MSLLDRVATVNTTAEELLNSLKSEVINVYLLSQIYVQMIFGYGFYMVEIDLNKKTADHIFFALVFSMRPSKSSRYMSKSERSKLKTSYSESKSNQQDSN